MIEVLLTNEEGHALGTGHVSPIWTITRPPTQGAPKFVTLGRADPQQFFQYQYSENGKAYYRRIFVGELYEFQLQYKTDSKLSMSGTRYPRVELVYEFLPN